MKHFWVMALELGKIAKNKPCPLCNLNIFQWIIITLCENVCWQNISAKFDNQPNPMKHLGVMALELAKIAKINRVHSVTWIFFNGSSSISLVYYYTGVFCDIVCKHNLLAKSNNQPDPMKHFSVMALDLSKIVQINLVLYVTCILFNGSSSNFVTLFVGIISWPSSITSQIHWKTLELWPLN